MTLWTRPAASRDAAGLAPLLGQLGYPATTQEARARLAYWSADERGLVLVADDQGTIAGVAAVHAIPLLEHTGSRGRLVALVVADRYRRQGIAGALLAAAEAYARSLGCLDMEITSARDRDGAHAFYLRAGYSDACPAAARYRKRLA
jgi:GNAT superfamily N-acetyltransferase